MSAAAGRRGIGLRALLRAAVFAGCLVALLVSAPSADAATKKFEVGYADLRYRSANPEIRADSLGQTQSVNGKVVRLGAGWSRIAPKVKTPGFDPTDPASPEYDWGTLDEQIRDAQASGMRVLLMVSGAPTWAEGDNRPPSALPGTWKPDPGELADFATALARRYSGNFQGLPRVRDFLCWGEANLKANLNPLWGGPDGKKPVAPLHYRKMLNAFYKAIHGVNKSNLVVTAELAPYGARPGLVNMRPMLFWRKVMCLKKNRKLSKTHPCTKAKFDVLAHNPINTSGGPDRGALNPDDVSVKDMHNLVHLLRVAERRHTVKGARHHPVWATEIWWESAPPDPAEVNPSLKKQAAWYAYSLYSLWKQGASMVLLLQVQDAPYNGTPGRDGDNYQSGVFFADGTPKPAAATMRFPFVAVRQSKNRVVLWGIAPKSGNLEVSLKGRKKPLAHLRARAGSVFKKEIRLPGKGKQVVRAKVSGKRSPAWVVAKPRRYR